MKQPTPRLIVLFPILFVATFLPFSKPASVATTTDEYFVGPGATRATIAENGMVSTSNPYATLAAVDTLKAGGNAIDAAVVAQFVLNVVEPYASGIGGGCFIMIYDSDSGEVIAIDGREEAPEAYHSNVFLDEEGKPIPFPKRMTGGNPVGVPGTLAAMKRALEEYGTISLSEALQPAIRLAHNGFTIDAFFAWSIDYNAKRLSMFSSSAALYLNEDKTPKQEGDFFTNPDLANTLNIIAGKGIDLFYRGEIARDIVDTVRNAPFNPGVMTLKDLELYRAVHRRPVTTTYRGYETYSMNMPTSGGTTLMMALNLLEGIDLPRYGWGSLEAIHRIADAQNIAFADRNAYMGDADFVDVPVDGLLDKGYARERRKLMSCFNAISTPIEPGTPPGISEAVAPPSDDDHEGSSTTHFSIVDKQRNLVSVTSTIELYFGCAVTVPGRGFLLNNELTDFDTYGLDNAGNIFPNGPEGGKKLRHTALGNDAKTQGGKRPRSSMSPMLILKDGQPVMTIGSPGGILIIGITLNAILNVLDFGMDLQEGVNAPRVVACNGHIGLESDLYSDSALVAGLEAKGFRVKDVGRFGSVQTVMIGSDGKLYGAADPRQGGLTLGY